MIFSNKELIKAAELIENELPELSKELKNMAEKSDTIDLINRNMYIASILWSSIDIETALKEEGFSSCDENINKVLAKLQVKDLEDCSNGWETITSTIYQIEDSLVS